MIRICFFCAVAVYALLTGCRTGGELSPETPGPELPEPVAPAAQATEPTEREAAEPAAPTFPAIGAPAALGTAETSLAAAPAWWDRTDHGYAPQPEHAEKLFERAAQPPSDKERNSKGLLVCRLDVGNYIDGGVFKPNTSADLTTEVSVDFASGGKTSLVAVGGQNKNISHVTLPLLRLHKGDRITLKTYDRQLLTAKHIATVKLVFSGALPLRGATSMMKARCRLVGRAVLEKRLAAQLPGADRALGQAQQAFHFDPQDAHLGGARKATRTGGASGAKVAIDRLAGLVGWDDPRVRVRVAFMIKLDRRYARERKDWFAGRRRTSPGPGTWVTLADGALALRVEKLRCGPAVVRRYHRRVTPDLQTHLKHVGCVLHLTARNQGTHPIPVEAGRIGPLRTLELIANGGLRFQARPGMVVVNGKLRRLRSRTVIAPSASLEVVWVPWSLRGLERGKLTPFWLRGVYSGRQEKVTTRGWTRLGQMELRLVRVACGSETTDRYLSAALDYIRARGQLQRSNCVLLFKVRNAGAKVLTLAFSPLKVGGLNRLELTGGKRMRINLTPLARLQGGKAAAFPEVKVAKTLGGESYTDKERRLLLKPGAVYHVAFLPERKLSYLGLSDSGGQDEVLLHSEVPASRVFIRTE